MPLFEKDGETIVFIHIPKTGGNSVRNWLSRKAERVAAKHCLSPHMFSDEYVSLKFLTEEEWEKANKLAVVRNPWDRMASAFKFWRQRRGKKEEFERFAHELIDRAARLQEGDNSEAKKSRHGSSLSRFLRGFDGEIVEFGDLKTRFPGIERKNVSKDKTPYQEFYTPETIKLIADTYAEDIERFGYRFE